MNVPTLLQSFLEKAKESGFLDGDDEVYVRNQILDLLQEETFSPAKTFEGGAEFDMLDLLDNLVEQAVTKGLIPDFLDEKEVFSAKIMDVFLPPPSVLRRRFDQAYRSSPVKATSYFYDLSRKSNYIQTKRIAKNQKFSTPSVYGDLDITINLSKPEKDPLEIERQRHLPSVTYPACQLCVENVGYAGHAGYPARSNHRVIPLKLENETWFFQYSPYLYYEEHCIVLSQEHRDMKIDKQAFQRLLTFVQMFPHYFLGSNADLPIVGGSILSHDHYQGGRYEFAMDRAKADFSFKLFEYPAVSFSTLAWPLSVIRLDSPSRMELIAAADHILTVWRGYSDPEAEILAQSEGKPHNAVTPIARRQGKLWELDLVLRNNRCTDQYPLGIFHPHPEVHHIKKENIGLIEVMGLAVLPARLATELELVEAFLVGKTVDIPEMHRPWAEELLERYSKLSDTVEVKKIVQVETGAKFCKALENAGVFKRDQRGEAAFRRFLSFL